MSKTYENTLQGQGYFQKGTGVSAKRDRGVCKKGRGMYTYENGVVGSVGGMV